MKQIRSIWYHMGLCVNWVHWNKETHCGWLGDIVWIRRHYQSWHRPLYKSCLIWPMEHCDKPELRLGQVKGFYISGISDKMHLASHTNGSVIPWNTLNFIFIKTRKNSIFIFEFLSECLIWSSYRAGPTKKTKQLFTGFKLNLDLFQNLIMPNILLMMNLIWWWNFNLRISVWSQFGFPIVVPTRVLFLNDNTNIVIGHLA